MSRFSRFSRKIRSTIGSDLTSGLEWAINPVGTAATGGPHTAEAARREEARRRAAHTRGVFDYRTQQFRALGGARPESVNPTAKAIRSARGSVVSSTGSRSGSRFVIPRERRRGLTASSFVIDSGIGITPSRGLNLVI